MHLLQTMSLSLSTNKELMEGKKNEEEEERREEKKMKKKVQKENDEEMVYLCFYCRLAKVKFVEDKRMPSSTFVFAAEPKSLEYVSHVQS